MIRSEPRWLLFSQREKVRSAIANPESVTPRYTFEEGVVEEYTNWQARAAIAEMLEIPRIKEALDFYEACQSAFEVNGEFKVTKEALRGKGGVSASM